MKCTGMPAPESIPGANGGSISGESELGTTNLRRMTLDTDCAAQLIEAE